MRKEAYYFSHDMNAQDDPKCIKLINEMGMVGYGIFWALIEKLRAEPEFKLKFEDIDAFALRWHAVACDITKVIKSYKLFVFDDDFFYSKRLIAMMDLKSERARKSANYRWKKENKNADASGRMQLNAIKGKKNNNDSAFAGEKKQYAGAKKMVY